MSHSNDEVVFYDGMSDEELDKLLQASLGENENTAPDTEPDTQLDISPNDNSDELGSIDDFVFSENDELLTLTDNDNENINLDVKDTFQEDSSLSPSTTTQHQPTAIHAQNNSQAPELIIDDDMNDFDDEVLELGNEVANFGTEEMTNFDIDPSDNLDTIDNSFDNKDKIEQDIEPEIDDIDIEDLDRTLGYDDLDIENNQHNPEQNFEPEIDIEDIDNSLVGKELNSNKNEQTTASNNDDCEWDKLLSDVEVVDENSEIQHYEYSHYHNTSQHLTMPEPIKQDIIPIEKYLENPESINTDDYDTSVEQDTLNIDNDIENTEATLEDTSLSNHQNDDANLIDDISNINTDSQSDYQEIEETEYATINGIKNEVQDLKSQLSLLTQQFQQLSDMSLQLVGNLRQFQQTSDDDFSATYKQVYELRKHIVTSRQKAEALPSLLDLTEETLETDLYMAEIKKKRTHNV